MPLQQGDVQGYDFNRSVVEFTMLYQGKRAKQGPLPLADVSSIEDLRAPVAQLDRALPSEGKGRTFESSRARQLSRLFALFRHVPYSTLMFAV